MFNLDQAIAQWRLQMLKGGVRTPEYLDELESHLRDDVAQQTRRGLDAAQAFAAATDRVGRPAALRTEFNKRGKLKRAMQTTSAILQMRFSIWPFSAEQLKRAAMAVAGIPIQYVPANMPGANIEPRWATYFRTAIFFGPALLIWMAAVFIVEPKLREVCLKADIQGGQDPQLSRLFVALGDAMNFLKAHWIAFSVPIVAVLALLEWRSSRWPRYRRAVLGAGAFLLNLAALIFIFFMVLIAVVAASKLMILAK